MEEKKVNYRISIVTAGLMLGTAVLFDLIGIFPGIGEFTSTFGAATFFGIWFLILGVPLLSPKKIASWGTNFFIESIPGLSEIWLGVTCGIILIIVITRFEDKTGVSVLNKTSLSSKSAFQKSARVAMPQKAPSLPTPKPSMNDLRPASNVTDINSRQPTGSGAPSSSNETPTFHDEEQEAA